MELAASNAQPKLSLPTLEPKNNYYVVPFGGRFHYFPIKIDEASEEANFMRFEKCPPILVDGVVIYKKKIYSVTARDIMRCIVNKAREIIQERDNHGSSRTSNTDTAAHPAVRSHNQTIRDEEQFQFSRTTGVEVDPNVDAAWDEQVDSLLNLVSSKEGGEWEVADSAQP